MTDNKATPATTAPTTEATNAPPYDAHGFNDSGYCSRWYDRNGFYGNGWSVDGHVNRETGTQFDTTGWSRDNLHKETGTKLNPARLTKWEALPPRDAEGYDFCGRDVRGLCRRGFSRQGYHVESRTMVDPNGYDSEGFDADGADEQGFYGWEATEELIGFNKLTGTLYDANGYTFDGLKADGTDSTGTFWY